LKAESEFRASLSLKRLFIYGTMTWKISRCLYSRHQDGIVASRKPSPPFS